MKRWATADDRAIAKLAATHTAKQLAKVLGRSVHAVHQRAYRKRVRLQKAGDADFRTKYSDAVVEQARKLHEAGVGPRAIARRIGVPEGSVRSFVYYRGRAHASLVLVGPQQVES